MLSLLVREANNDHQIFESSYLNISQIRKFKYTWKPYRDDVRPTVITNNQKYVFVLMSLNILFTFSMPTLPIWFKLCFAIKNFIEPSCFLFILSMMPYICEIFFMLVALFYCLYLFITHTMFVQWYNQHHDCTHILSIFLTLHNFDSKYTRL